MNLVRLICFCTFLLCYILFNSAKNVVVIDRVEYENFREDVVTNIKSEMQKISRTESAPTIRFTLLRDLDNITLSVGLYRINGAQKLKLPFNITADMCTLLEKDFLVAKDFKRMGLTNCPIAAKDWVLEKIQFDVNNLPKVVIYGHLMLKFFFFYEKKPIATADIYLTIRESAKGSSKKRNPEK